MKYLLIITLIISQSFSALCDDSTSVTIKDITINPYEMVINEELEEYRNELGWYTAKIKSAPDEKTKRIYVLQAIERAHDIKSDECEPVFFAVTLAVAPFIGAFLDDRTILDGIEAPFTRCNRGVQTRDAFLIQTAQMTSELDFEKASQTYNILNQLIRLKKSCPSKDLEGCRGANVRQRLLEQQLNELK